MCIRIIYKYPYNIVIFLNFLVGTKNYLKYQQQQLVGQEVWFIKYSWFVDIYACKKSVGVETRKYEGQFSYPNFKIHCLP